MSDSLSSRLARIEREIQALKVGKMRSSSVLKTKTTKLSLSFECISKDYDVWATQAAYVTVSADGTGLTAITFDGDWDGRIYTARRVVGSATDTVWLVVPNIFLISDRNAGAQPVSFALTRSISITSTYDATISVSYGDNPFAEELL